MIDLTQKEAQAIKSDAITRGILIRDIEFNEINYPGRYNNDKKKEQISMLTDKIRHACGISPDQSIDDICDIVYYTLNLPDHNPDIRHITVDELPKEPRSTRLPKKINPATFSKKAARFINRMQTTGTQRTKWNSKRRRYNRIPQHDSITHIETGRIWNANTGATAEEFLEAMK